MSLIRVENVTFAYSAKPEKQALCGLNLEVERGNFVGITGVSDAGKSSLCRLVSGYIPHLFGGELSGSVTVDGVSTAEATVAELADKVGFVFENPFDQLTGANLTVLEEVAFALENMGVSPKTMEVRAKESLERVGIAHLADRHPRRLSGGQSQRVALASVLALRPEIFVLDEPTSQLDPLGAGEVFEVVAEMRRQGYTVLVVSQDLDRLAIHADRLLVIEDGRILRDGTPREVLTAATESKHSLLIPKVVEVGRRLRRESRIEAERPLPLTVEEAAGELTPMVAHAGTSESLSLRKGTAHPSQEDVPRIALEDVSHTYPGGVHALQGLSLQMTSGCVCLVGQNGAGKTTLIKHLNGLLKPTEGRVLVRGRDTRAYRVAQLARDVGLAFQNPNDQLFRGTVEEEVRFGTANVGASPEEAERLTEKAIRLMGLGEVRKEQPYDLGLPIRKRVAIASVLTMDGPVVVLDEPTGGQDAPGVALLGELVSALTREGKLVVVVTHDIEFSAKHADRVIALYQGKVILDGEPREVLGDEETLARTYVRPPAVARIGFRCGLNETVLSLDELFAAAGVEIGGEDDPKGNTRL